MLCVWCIFSRENYLGGFSLLFDNDRRIFNENLWEPLGLNRDTVLRLFSNFDQVVLTLSDLALKNLLLLLSYYEQFCQCVAFEYILIYIVLLRSWRNQELLLLR